MNEHYEKMRILSDLIVQQSRLREEISEALSIDCPTTEVDDMLFRELENHELDWVVGQEILEGDTLEIEYRFHDPSISKKVVATEERIHDNFDYRGNNRGLVEVPHPDLISRDHPINVLEDLDHPELMEKVLDQYGDLIAQLLQQNMAPNLDIPAEPATHRVQKTKKYTLPIVNVDATRLQPVQPNGSRNGNGPILMYSTQRVTAIVNLGGLDPRENKLDAFEVMEYMSNPTGNNATTLLTGKYQGRKTVKR